MRPWVRLSHFKRVEKGERKCEGRKVRQKKGVGMRRRESCGCETRSCLALLVGVKRAEKKEKVNNTYVHSLDISLQAYPLQISLVNRVDDDG